MTGADLFTLSPAGRGQGEGVLRLWHLSDSEPPHPNPLPTGEREFVELSR